MSFASTLIGASRQCAGSQEVVVDYSTAAFARNVLRYFSKKRSKVIVLEKGGYLPPYPRYFRSGRLSAIASIN